MYEIFLGKDSLYYFRLKAGNGEIILKSEAYNTKQSCKDGIASVKRHAPYDSNYDRRNSTNGQYYFNLKANNNQIIGTSEVYSSAQARNTGIEACKRIAPTAPIKDLTQTQS